MIRLTNSIGQVDIIPSENLRCWILKNRGEVKSFFGNIGDFVGGATRLLRGEEDEDGEVPPAAAAGAGGVPPAAAAAPENHFLDQYFTNQGEINSQAADPVFGTQILVGPKTPGFFGKKATPFAFASIEGQMLRGIRKEDTTLFGGMVNDELDILGAHPSLNYDSSGALQKMEHRLDFTANLSQRGEINLPPNAKKVAGIHQNATSYYFVYPANFLESKELQARMHQTPDYFKRLQNAMIEVLGEEVANLAIIGGFAYFDKDGNLVQIKAIVPKATDDLLFTEDAVSINELPRALKAEFYQSKDLLNRPIAGMKPRDGKSNEITAPELRALGAKHFAYIPQGYGGHQDFWERHAPFGLFVYSFDNPQYDCFLPIAVEKQVELAPGGAQKVNVTKADGSTLEIRAHIAKACGCCENAAPNVVYQVDPATKAKSRRNPLPEGEYFALCCSDCSNNLNEKQKNGIARATVLDIYPFTVQKGTLEFFDHLNLKSIQNIRSVKLDQMAQSRAHFVNLSPQERAKALIPNNAHSFRMLYPAEKLASKEMDHEIVQLYNVGGFAYFDAHDNVVGINYFSAEAGGARLNFDPVEELQLTANSQQTVQAQVRNNNLPHVTIKALRSKGVRDFMWVPPQDENFSSKFGQFLYFSADGTKVFAKKVSDKETAGQASAF